jgi:hypothetical protein
MRRRFALLSTLVEHHTQVKDAMDWLPFVRHDLDVSEFAQ